MKYTVALLLAAASVQAASPRHRHHHRHAVKPRVVDPVDTVVVYELDGKLVPEAEVLQGLANGTFYLADGGSILPASQSPTSAAPTSVYVAPTTSAAPTTTSTSSSSSSSSAAASSSAASSSYGSSSGLDRDYDGSVDCGSFPSEFGAMAVDYLGLGGWTGLQKPGYSGSNGYNDIQATDIGSCKDGSCCTEGTFCSYACPAGYLKTAWPKLQGVTGQSVGGLLCQNGKLTMPDGSISKKLCIPGTDEVTINVQNKIGGGATAAVCRTDYPSSESEVIPLETVDGSTYPLACPNQDTYYQYFDVETQKYLPTTAQYYINPKNVAVDDACQWGSSANNYGNWAPLNVGVGYTPGSPGMAYLSIFQNSPTTNAKLDFDVEIVGDQVNGKCKYFASSGQYCSGDSYDNCNSVAGCTVAVPQGATATFVLS